MNFAPSHGADMIAADSLHLPASHLADCRPILNVRDVHKKYYVNGRVSTIFSGLNCAFHERSFVSIIGPSGCGKSTLLKLLAGLESVTSGQVTFKSQNVTSPPKGMVYVFQQYSKSIFPWRTVIQNVAFGLASSSFSKSEINERCMEYLKLVGLTGYENYYPSQVSGGMQQRVAIARALIGQPDVLLMDEPFSAVDAMTRAVLQDLLLRIWEKLPVTILFVTHDVEEAVFLSTDIITLAKSPGGIRESTAVDLPYPRNQMTSREDPRFIALRHHLFSNIFAQEASAEAGLPLLSSKDEP